MVRKKLSAWTKNNLREVKNTFERYIAIIGIIAIGVAFFAGLVITRDTMVATLDKYLVDHNMYDYRLLSTVAFDKDDYKHFEDLDGVKAAEGGISIDFHGTLKERDQTLIFKAHSITEEIGKLKLVTGRLPDNANEAVADSLNFNEDIIGETIKISNENDQDTLDTFALEEYTIVGTVQSTEYISPQRGTTNIANGSINAFIYIPEQGFDVDYYTEMFVKLDQDGFPYTKDYEELISENEEMIKRILDDRANARFSKVIDEANEEIAEAELEYQDGYNEYLSEKADVTKELEDAYAEILDGQNEILENEQKLVDGQEEIDEGLRKYNKGLRQYEDGLAEFEANKEITLKTLKEKQEEIDNNRAQVSRGINEIETSGVIEQYASLQEALTQLDENISIIDDNRPAIENGIKAIESSEAYPIIRQYDDISEGIDYYSNLKAQIQKNPLFIQLLQEQKTLEERLNILEAKPESETTKEEIAEIELIKASILEIESNPLIHKFYEVDQLLDTLLLYQDLTKTLSNMDQLILERNVVIDGIEQIEASGVIDQYNSLQKALIQLDEGQAQLNEGLINAEEEFTKAEQKLAKAKEELDEANNLLSSSQEEIDQGWETLNEGKAELADGLLEYEDGKKEAEEAFAEAEQELDDGKREIDDAKEKIADLKSPTTYVFDRSSNTGYSSFDNDSAIVAGIARVLPIFFFLVAALVCSTTMSRMVDEQRTQIGTLKSLGYSDIKITNKYVAYAGSAATIGCVIGYLLGITFLPWAIWTAFGMLYKFAPIEFIFDWKLALISLLVSLLSSAGVTFFTCRKELASTPANLIRPKAPKPGKRVLLERIPFVWNNLSFLRKVSIRNIFRYKKRLLMTILGISGCTALIVAALGINDSIGNIANFQFDDIMTYQYEVYYTEEMSDEDKDEFNEKHNKVLSENVFVAKETFELIVNDHSKTFNLISTDDQNISKLIHLNIDGQNIGYPKDGEVALNTKLADEAGVSVGDNVTIKISDTEHVEATLGGIYENYIDNYMYVTDTTYEMLFGEKPAHLNSFATTSQEGLDSVAGSIASDENVATLISTQNIREVVDDTMTSLNYVIWIVLGFAVALALIVVYNLNNINITERTREIATLKVLGFYEKETHVYVFRENLVLTAVGIFIGLFLGRGLLTFIMGQIKVDFVTFKQQIFPQSYIISVVVTFLITIGVNLILSKKIDKINMAESLNSGE